METKQAPWKDFRLHICVLICSVIAELIGPIVIPLGNMSIKLLPLIYSMVLVLVLYLWKPFTFLGEKQAGTAAGLLSLSVALLCAKLGVVSGSAMDKVVSAGPILLLQNLGNLGTIVFALPIALFLGMKREAIGLTHALSREPNVALISDKYGANSDEFKGVITVYVVGTIFGSIFMSIIPPIFVNLGILSPEAASMGVGAGSAAMMTAGLASLVDIVPEKQATLTAFASLSNIISTVIAVYLAIFVGLPLCEKIYKFLEPLTGKKSFNESDNKQQVEK